MQVTWGTGYAWASSCRTLGSGGLSAGARSMLGLLTLMYPDGHVSEEDVDGTTPEAST